VAIGAAVDPIGQTDTLLPTMAIASNTIRVPFKTLVAVC
jgi:hypothetical protein